MRSVILLSLIVASVGFGRVARGEVFEVPLPEVVGEYVPFTSPQSPATRREFGFEVGFPLAEIHEVRIRVEGSMVAQLAGFTEPRDLYFFVSLRDGDSWAETTVGRAGSSTYPEPEPFAEENQFRYRSDWDFLEDGSAGGSVVLSRGLTTPGPLKTGGSGTITGAWLIIDATPVPEPGGVGVIVVGVGMLWRRRRCGTEHVRSGW